MRGRFMVLGLLAGCIELPDFREPPPAVVARVESEPKDVEYPVHGETGKQVYEAMGDVGEVIGGKHGHVEWRLKVHHQSAKSAAGCRLTEVVVKASTTSILPTWVEAPAASEPDRQWWSRYSTRLAAYHAEVRARTLDGAERLRLAGAALPPEPTCTFTERLRALQDTEVARIREEIAEASALYRAGELGQSGPMRTVTP